MTKSCAVVLFFFSSRRRHTRCSRDWSSDVCSSDLDRNANPESNLGSGSLCARRGTSLWFARYRPGQVARDGAPLLASSLARRIPRFFVRGGRAVRHPALGLPAFDEITTVTATESCKASAPAAVPTPPYSYLKATIGSTRMARCAGTQHARNATTQSRMATATKVMGSVDLMPKSNPERRRVDARAKAIPTARPMTRSEEHTSELQSRLHLVCRLL